MRAHKTDANQTHIVNELRSIGAFAFSVAVTSAVGRGFPDIVVGYRGRNYLLEIKDGAKKPSARKLTADEKRFHEDWRGTVYVITCVQDFLNIVLSESF